MKKVLKKSKLITILVSFLFIVSANIILFSIIRIKSAKTNNINDLISEYYDIDESIEETLSFTSK